MFDVFYNNLEGFILVGLLNMLDGWLRFNVFLFEGNVGLYGFFLLYLKGYFLFIFVIVGIGFGSGFLSLIVSFIVVCIWLCVME